MTAIKPGSGAARPSLGYGFDDIWQLDHNSAVVWTVLLHPEFDREFMGFPAKLEDELLAHAKLLQTFGPQFGRPTVDTLKGSRHANMKELRFAWQGDPWRFAFAFDPARRAVLLAGGNKAGQAEKRFYKRLIAVADRRMDGYLAAMSAEKGRRKEKS